MAIESLEVSHSRYLGRTEPFRVKFNPWLNSIIGGRGTGKSTLVEFLRIAMRREDELSEDFRKDLIKYWEVHRIREDGGLLTDNTSIRVYFRIDDALFRIQWSPNGDHQPIERQITDTQWIMEDGDIPQRFPVRIFSQKQIFDLAKRPLALLRLVDDSLKESRREWTEKWSLAERKFLSLRAKVRELESDISKESRLRGELEDIKRKQKIIEHSGYANVLKNFQKFTRQKRDIQEWVSMWEGFPDQLREMANGVVADFLGDDSFSFDSEPETELKDYIAQVRIAFEDLNNEISSLAHEAEDILSECQRNIASSQWEKAAIFAEKAYHDLKNQFTKEAQNHP